MGNRSANTYQKIDTIFKRDANNIIMPYDELVSPELEFLRKFNVKFEASEKVDGSNHRIEIYRNLNFQDPQNDSKPNAVYFTMAIKGKSDDANIPAHLEKFMKETFPLEKVLNALGLKEWIPVEEWEEHKWGTKNEKTGEFVPDWTRIPELYTIYGEGYGVKIQKGGNYISNGVGFIVFDVKVNNLYLNRPAMEEIADKLGAPHVPYMGEMTIDEAIAFVRKGFKSTIAENKDYDAEGLVLKTSLGLKTRMGERIIFKVKTCDWQRYFAKYGTYDKVDQPVNTKYVRE